MKCEIIIKLVDCCVVFLVGRGFISLILFFSFLLNCFQLQSRETAQSLKLNFKQK